MAKNRTLASIAEELLAEKEKSSWTSSTTLKTAWEYAKQNKLSRDMPMRIASEMNQQVGIKPGQRDQTEEKTKPKSNSKAKPKSNPKTKAESRSRSRSRSMSRGKLVHVYLSGGANRVRFPMSKTVMKKHLSGMGVKVVSGKAHWIVLAPGVRKASKSAMTKAGKDAKVISWTKFMEQYPIPE